MAQRLDYERIAPRRRKGPERGLRLCLAKRPFRYRASANNWRTVAAGMNSRSGLDGNGMNPYP
jgi:hypothetical protein